MFYLVGLPGSFLFSVLLSDLDFGLRLKQNEAFFAFLFFPPFFSGVRRILFVFIF